MTRLLDTAFVVLFGVVLAAVAVFLIVPIVMTVLMSFDGREYLGRFPPPVLSLRWYTAFFFDSYYMVALRNSAIISTVAATLATATGVTAAVLLDRYRFRGREALSAFFLSPLVVPTVVMGFSVLMFLSLLGLYDGFVRLIAGHVVITVPYTIRTTLASLVGIKRSLVEAALSLGADERRAFRDVTFPLAKTGIVAGARPGVRAVVRGGLGQPLPLRPAVHHAAGRDPRRDAVPVQSHAGLGLGGHDGRHDGSRPGARSRLRLGPDHRRRDLPLIGGSGTP